MSSLSSTSKSARKQMFKKEYSKKWSCISSSRRDEYSARCTLCSSDFSISHGGANDIQIHVRSKKHQSAVRSSKSTGNIAQFLQPKDFSVIRAETLMTQFLIEHNLPFAAADHLTDLVKVMFPDSSIASKFASRRTKTTAIARTLGQEAKADILRKIRQGPFSMSTDGSSDRGADNQLYPIVVRYYDSDAYRVVSCLLEIATTKERSTGKNIFLLLDSVLKENNIPWQNVISFSADNAAVMIGAVSGVSSFVKKENPSAFILGCPCHLLHLAAEKGASQLPFKPVDLLIPIFYYLEKSSKRHKAFKEVQTICNVENHAILKHVCTRWLSLERALDRLIEQWVPLEKYFQQEAQSVGVKRRMEESAKLPKRQKVSSSTATHQGPAVTAHISSTKTIPPSADSGQGKKKKNSSHSQTCSTASAAPRLLIASSKTSVRGQVAHKAVKTAASTGSSKSSGGTLAVKKTTPGLLSRKTVTSLSMTEGTTSKKSHKSSETKNVSTSKSVQRNSGTAGSSASASLSKAAEIHAKLNNDYNKLYCIFLLQTIPLFNKLNLELQEDAPKVHLLHEKLQDFLREILLRFVKPAVIVSTSSLKLCDYKERCNQKADEDIIVGKNVRDFLTAAQFSSKERDEFHTSVREYYVAVCNYVISKFPLNDEVLLHARVANPNNRMEVTYSSLSFFVKRFKFMEEALDKLEVEFAQFQIDKLENVSLDKRSDEAWVDIAGIRDKSTGQLKYVHLPKVMLAILSLPHSNADDERIFSLVRKNATEFRPSLSTQTLSDFLTQKIQSQSKKILCHQMQFPDNLLQNCKKAAAVYNRQ